MSAVALAETEISLANTFQALGYRPHPGQRQLHMSQARHRVADFGRRAGKSTAGGNELVPEALRSYHLAAWLKDMNQQKRFWIVGPNYDDAEREFRVFYNSCKKLQLPFDKPGTYYNPGQPGAHTVSLWDSAFILECRSAAHPESLDGEGLDGVVMAEAAKMKRSIWGKFIRPALADKRGWSLWNSTPEGKNHFYEAWQRGQDSKHPSWESWKFPSWVNTRVFPGGRYDPEIMEMAQEMSAERFKQEVCAEFTDYVGRVFKDWDEETHVRNLEYDPRLPLYGAVDYGWRNPFVWLALQVDAWDNVYVLGEYYVQEKDINDIADDLGEWGLARNADTFYPDPADPGSTKVLEKSLRMRAKGNTGGELKHRLELIRRHLKLHPDNVPEEQRDPKLFVDRSCTNMIREMDEYRYPDDKTEEERRGPAKEEPLKKNDHCPEALGRFFRGYYGGPGADRGRSGARVSRANVRRAA